MKLRILIIGVLCGLGMGGRAYGMERIEVRMDPIQAERCTLRNGLEVAVKRYFEDQGIKESAGYEFDFRSNIYLNVTGKSVSGIMFIGMGSEEARRETANDIRKYDDLSKGCRFIGKVALFRIHELALPAAALLSIGAVAGALIAYCCTGKTSEQPEPATDNKKK